MPTRVTCRLIKKEKLSHPPPLMEGEALAARIVEMGPVMTKFLGPVVIEIPHFASLRGREREIMILRSENGETWREHVVDASEEAIQETLNGTFDGEELDHPEELASKRITRILTTDFPQYFAIVTRIRQESHSIGADGGMLSSTVVPQVQAVFPEGALTKRIKVGLQAQPIASELVSKLLGNRVAVSAIVTVEPRRRKFHKPITLTIPVPQAASKGMLNKYGGGAGGVGGGGGGGPGGPGPGGGGLGNTGGNSQAAAVPATQRSDAPTLRLLCSITGGTTPAQWEDITGTTPLTFVNDCVSFTTTVSARFWLMDCQNVNEATRMATELYREAIACPFMSKFVVFAKRHSEIEARLRVFCMTDDKMDKTLESQENFVEVARSRDVEVLESKQQWVEMAGNLVPVTKSGEQLHLIFHAFRENRLPFIVRLKDMNQDPVARIAFMRQAKVGRHDSSQAPQLPICNLNLQLPDYCRASDDINGPSSSISEDRRAELIRKLGISPTATVQRAELRLSDIADVLQGDWVVLAYHLDLNDSDILLIKQDYPNNLSDQALAMMHLWYESAGEKATGNNLEKALKKIKREDVVQKCMYNIMTVTDTTEREAAKLQLDQSGFDAFKEELGPSRDSTLPKGTKIDGSYAESAEESGSETTSIVEQSKIPVEKLFKDTKHGEEFQLADKEVLDESNLDDTEKSAGTEPKSVVPHKEEISKNLDLLQDQQFPPVTAEVPSEQELSKDGQIQQDSTSPLSHSQISPSPLQDNQILKPLESDVQSSLLASPIDEEKASIAGDQLEESTVDSSPIKEEKPVESQCQDKEDIENHDEIPLPKEETIVDPPMNEEISSPVRSNNETNLEKTEIAPTEKLLDGAVEVIEENGENFDDHDAVLEEIHLPKDEAEAEPPMNEEILSQVQSNETNLEKTEIAPTEKLLDGAVEAIEENGQNFETKGTTDTVVEIQKAVDQLESSPLSLKEREIENDGEPGWNEQGLKQTSLEDEVEDAMKGSKPEVVTEETTLTSSDGKIHDTRVVMKKKVHKKTTVKDGKEETIVTTDMHVEHDDKGPEDLQAAMKEIIENFVEGTGEFSSEPNEEK